MTLQISKPSIVSYLHYAHDLSIIENDRRAGAYLATSFLQLHTKPDHRKIGLLVDFCTYDGGYLICPFLTHELLVGEAVASLGASPTEKVCSLIDNGYYVRIDLNEYHIKESLTFGKAGQDLAQRHKKLRPLHFNLIYKYSRQERKFYTHGFNREFRYAEREISFEELDYAYYGDDVGMHRLHLVPEGKGDEPIFDSSKIIRCLQNIIDSRGGQSKANKDSAWKKTIDFIRPHVNFGAAQPLGPSFEMAVYDVAARMVSKNNGRTIDIRPWCVIHDHKRSLLRLCDYLTCERGVDINHDVLKDLKLVEREFLRIRNDLLASRLEDRNVDVDSLRANLKQLKYVERTAIAALIEVVREDQLAASGKSRTVCRNAR